MSQRASPKYLAKSGDFWGSGANELDLANGRTSLKREAASLGKNGVDGHNAAVSAVQKATDAKGETIMKKIFNSIRAVFIGSLAGVLTAGCLGPELLEERSERGPPPDPKIELRLRTGQPADVLVIYNEENKSTGQVTRRGFYLFANETRLGKGKRPVFMKPGYIGRHVTVPIYAKSPADPKAVPGELYAVYISPWAFDLRSRGQSLAECRLPEYGNWLTAKKFFLLPLAAAVDVVGVGAVAGAVGAVVVGEAAAESNVSFTFP